jgi:hypothetical protein
MFEKSKFMKSVNQTINTSKERPPTTTLTTGVGGGSGLGGLVSFSSAAASIGSKSEL